jgi:hypothetical protein
MIVSSVISISDTINGTFLVEDPNADYLALSLDFIYDAISIRRNRSYSMYQNLETDGDLTIKTSIIEGSKSVVKITLLDIINDHGFTISINLLESLLLGFLS